MTYQRRSHFKEKLQTNIKNYNIRTSVFHFIKVATWGVLVLDRFLNSAFAISQQKKTPTSHFHSSEHVENKRKNYIIHVYIFRNHILTKNTSHCFSKSILPSDLKLPNATLVYKKMSKNSKDNYRPISILSDISKIYERCICDQIQLFFDSLLSKYQCRFCRSYNNCTFP